MRRARDQAVCEDGDSADPQSLHDEKEHQPGHAAIPEAAAAILRQAKGRAGTSPSPESRSTTGLPRCDNWVSRANRAGSGLAAITTSVRAEAGAAEHRVQEVGKGNSWLRLEPCEPLERRHFTPRLPPGCKLQRPEARCLHAIGIQTHCASFREFAMNQRCGERDGGPQRRSPAANPSTARQSDTSSVTVGSKIFACNLPVRALAFQAIALNGVLPSYSRIPRPGVPGPRTAAGDRGSAPGDDARGRPKIGDGVEAVDRRSPSLRRVRRPAPSGGAGTGRTHRRSRQSAAGVDNSRVARRRGCARASRADRGRAPSRR